jgi:ketosteroid isomerase-like protein
MNRTVSDTRRLAEGFIASTESRDIGAMRELFDPEATFWTNVTLADVDLESRLARIAQEFELFETFGFDAARVDAHEGGFLIRAQAKGSLPGGKAFDFPVCIVADARDGRIVRFEEYLDATPVAPILAALGGTDAGAGTGR